MGAEVRCGVVRCGAVRCGAVRCGAVRCGWVCGKGIDRWREGASEECDLIYSQSTSNPVPRSSSGTSSYLGY